MASSTAIGSASVVLSANADGLAAGLDRAERKVSDFAGDVGKKLDKAGGPGGGGGFLSKILAGGALGGAAGAVAGAVAGGVAKGFQLLGELPDLIRGLADGASGADAGPLKGLVAGMERLAERGKALLGGFFASIAPGALAIGDVLMKGMEAAQPVIRAVGAGLSRAFEFVAPLLMKGVEAAGMLAERLGQWAAPIVDKLGRGLEVVGFVLEAALTEGVTLFGEMLDGIGSVLEGIGSWANEFFSVETAIGTLEPLVFQFLKGFGKGAAMVWDTLRAGVGAMSYVGSFVVDGLARIVDAFKSTIKTLLRLAGTLPNSLGGAGFRRLADTVDRWPDAIGAAAQRMREWGAGAITSWGDSAQSVEAWFDRLEDRFRGRAGALAGMMEEAAKPLESKLGGALLKGSQESYSVVTKFQTQGMVSASDPAMKQIRLLEDVKRILQDVNRGLQNAPLLRAI